MRGFVRIVRIAGGQLEQPIYEHDENRPVIVAACDCFQVQHPAQRIITGKRHSLHNMQDVALSPA